LRAHSSVDAVIAVSNHWLGTAEIDARYFYYSAFSDRQVFIEGYDASRNEIPTDIDVPTGADVATRQLLNNDVPLRRCVGAENAPQGRDTCRAPAYSHDQRVGLPR
jgi:hypothetical protein